MDWNSWRGWLIIFSFLSAEALAVIDIIPGEDGCIPPAGATSCDPTPTPSPTPTATPTPTLAPTPTPTATPVPTPTPISTCPSGYFPKPIDTAILLLELEKWRALVVSDRAKLEATAPVWVNSSHKVRAAVVRERGQASAPSFSVVGKSLERHQGRFFGTVKNGVVAIQDPLQFLPEPNVAEMPVRANNKVGIKNRNLTLQPGIYRKDIEIGGKSVVTLEPGIYVIEGQLEVKDNAELIGRDVMLFFPTQQKRLVLRLHSDKKITLSPPLTGPYRGIVVYQRRSERARMRMRGDGEYKISGLIYSHDGKLRIGEKAKGVMASQLISRRLIVKRQAEAAQNWRRLAVTRTFGS